MPLFIYFLYLHAASCKFKEIHSLRSWKSTEFHLLHWKIYYICYTSYMLVLMKAMSEAFGSKNVNVASWHGVRWAIQLLIFPNTSHHSVTLDDRPVHVVRGEEMVASKPQAQHLCDELWTPNSWWGTKIEEISPGWRALWEQPVLSAFFPFPFSTLDERVNIPPKNLIGEKFKRLLNTQNLDINVTITHIFISFNLFFLTTLSLYLFRVTGRVSCGWRQPPSWMTHQFIAGSYMSICEFGILLKGTSTEKVLWNLPLLPHWALNPEPSASLPSPRSNILLVSGNLGHVCSLTTRR